MRLFISYAHVDRPIVEDWIVKKLVAGGHEVWFDNRLISGQPWKDQLNAAIERSDALVYCMTPESVASEWCQWELARAVELGKPITPVLLQAETALPPKLADLQYVDFSGGATGDAVARLMGGLQKLSPAQIPPAPSEPQGTPPQAVGQESRAKPKSNQVDSTISESSPQAVVQEAATKPGCLMKILRDPAFAAIVGLVGVLVAIVTIFVSVNPPPLQPTATATASLTAATLTDILSPSITPVSTYTPTQMHTPAFATTQAPTSTPDNTALVTPTNACPHVPEGMVCVSVSDIPPFAIDVYEVTRKDFHPFASDAANVRDSEARTRLVSAASSQDDKPMTHVTWDEARSYCLGRGEGYDLPTESQWLAAAHWDAVSGQMQQYPWGDVLPSVGNFSGDERSVGIYSPNALGLYDMAGNAAEWVRADSGVQREYRVLGGDYRSEPDEASRDNPGRSYAVPDPEFDLERIGLRCVLIFQF